MTSRILPAAIVSALALLGAFTLAACGSHPAPTNTHESAYLTAVRADARLSKFDDATLIGYGHKFCSDLDAGTEPQTFNDRLEARGIDYHDRSVLFDAAIPAYCPSHSSMLPDQGNN